MSNQGTFDFSRSDTVATDIDDVVHTANDEMVSVLVSGDGITREVVSWVGFEVDRQVTLMVSQAGTSHSGPWLSNGHYTFEVSVFIGFGQFLSSLRIQDYGIDTIKGEGAATRFHWSDSRNIGNDMSSRFGLPVGINDGAVLSSDNFIVPTPSFGIDWFSDGSQDLQTAQIVLLRCRISISHQQTNRSGSCVELCDFVTLHHIPVTSFIRIDRSTFKHKGCRSVQ
mmetsp:Transcript_2648/g.7593  ORF Transcript_2648/g.7593 Transcript_2648/m.7593 type:complete len:225 (-) Transcript_2648:79-753(-)